MTDEQGRLSSLAIGFRLKTARDKRGYTMLQLAERSGLGSSTIDAIEKGKKTPRADTVERLARALKVPRCWLAYGDGKKPDWDAAMPS
jgi:transcriptional regulator with XRE-family HTH domain